MKRILIGLIITFSGIFGAFISPFYALCVYIWFAYMRTQEWMRNPSWFVSMRPSLLLAFCVISACIIHQKKMIRWNFQTLLILCLWFWIFICHLNSVNSIQSAYWLDYFSKLMIMGFLITGLVESKEKLFYILLPFTLGLGFYSAKSGLYGVINPGAKILQGPGGMLTDNNSFATAFGMILPFIFFSGTFFIKNKFIKLGYTIVFYLSILGIVFTYSRGGFLGLCVVLFFIGIRGQKNIIKLFIFACIGGILVFIFIPQSYKNRIKTIVGGEKGYDSSSSGRIHFWKVAFVMAKENPIFGVGAGCYPNAYQRYDFSKGKFGKKKAVHNSFLQMLTDNGFPGLALFSLLIFMSLYTCHYWRKKARGRPEFLWIEHTANIFQISIIGYCVSGFFLSMAYADLIYHLFFLVIALDKLAKEHMKRETIIVYSENYGEVINSGTLGERSTLVDVNKLDHVTTKTVKHSKLIISDHQQFQSFDSWNNWCSFYQQCEHCPTLLILKEDPSFFIQTAQLSNKLSKNTFSNAIYIAQKPTNRVKKIVKDHALTMIVYNKGDDIILNTLPDIVIVDISICSIDLLKKILELTEYQETHKIPIFFTAPDYKPEMEDISHEDISCFIKTLDEEEELLENI